MRLTFAYGSDAGGETESAESVVKYLVEFQRGRGVVGDLDAGRQTVKDAIAPQDRVRLGGYQDARLSVAENVVLLQDALAAVEDAYASVSAVEYFVPLINWLTIQLIN